MSANAVILTIPSLAADLKVSQLEAQWVSSAYSLAYGCGLLFAGRLADIFGRKMLFLGGVAVAAIFFFVCGAMRSLIGLCVVRALCGLGLAVSTPSAFGIVGINFRDEPERTILFSVLGLGNPVGASVGMLVGGGVAGAARQGWQYLYFVLGGLALIPLVVGFFVLPPEPRRTQPVDTRIDWLGGFLVTAALCLFTFSITESGVAPRGWSTPYVGALLGVSIVLFAAFGWWEHRVENKLSFPPIVKLSLFTRGGGTISIVLLASFLPFVAVSGWVYLVSLFYQELKGMSPLANAIRTLPASICGIVAALGVMFIVPRVRAPFVFMAGGLLTGVACLIFAVEPENTIYWACEFISMLCLPFGADLTTGIGSILMSNLCDDDEQSVAGALFQTATQIASALGICLSSLVQHDVAERTGSYYVGLRHAFGFTAAWAWAVVLIAGIFLRKMGLAKHVGHGGGGSMH
jgi:MFS family permease